MRIRVLVLAVAAGWAVCDAARAQIGVEGAAGRWFYGSGFGLRFGDDKGVAIAPYFGRRLGERVAVGAGVEYIFHDVKAYDRHIRMNDYGANVFASCVVFDPFFVQVEVEQLDYEYARATIYEDHTDVVQDRNSATSFLGGAGVSMPMGDTFGLYAAALYNLSYESLPEPSPYTSPWVFRVGISMSF